MASHLGYGGNTSCVEICAGNGTRFIIDAGTGLRDLGLAMRQDAQPSQEVRFLITHFHWDHVQGLPFFHPLYDSDQRFLFCSGYPAAESRKALEKMTGPPFFPVALAELPGERAYLQLDTRGESIGGVRVFAFPLNHPQGGWGFRLEHGGAAIVHACDYEHGSAESDRTLVEHCRGADVLIYDAQYTPEEYPEHEGWGHSTWAEAVRFAKETGAGRLILFHHDPAHDDGALDDILARARSQFPNVDAAREGMTIEVSGH